MGIDREGAEGEVCKEPKLEVRWITAEQARRSWRSCTTTGTASCCLCLATGLGQGNVTGLRSFQWLSRAGRLGAYRGRENGDDLHLSFTDLAIGVL